LKVAQDAALIPQDRLLIGDDPPLILE